MLYSDNYFKHMLNFKHVQNFDTRACRWFRVSEVQKNIIILSVYTIILTYEKHLLVLINSLEIMYKYSDFIGIILCCSLLNKSQHKIITV